MTSANYSSKHKFFDKSLYKTLLKRNSWMLILGLILMTLFIVVPTILTILNEDYRSSNWVNRYYSGTANFILSSIAYGTFSPLFIFGYLFSKKKTDFFHALPNRRSSIFITSVAVAITLFLVPYVTTRLLQMPVLFTDTAVLNVFDFDAMLMSCVYELCIFFTLLSVSVLAIMLTGNAIVSFMGFLVLVLGFGLSYTTGILRTLYFPNISYSENFLNIPFLSWLISSPVEILVNFGNNEDLFTPDLFYLVTLCVIALLFSLFLYTKRPSENSGNSLVFKKSKNILKYLMLFSFTVYSGIFFSALWSNSSATNFGTYFGYVVGILLAHVVIECVVDLDIRAFKKGLKGLAIFSAIFFITIFVFFENDILKLNGYVPENDEVESIQFSSYRLGYDTIEYGHSDKSYFTLEDEKTIDATIALANRYYDELHASEDRYGISFNITYNLKNGQSKSRNFDVPIAEAEELLSLIYSSEEFKNDKLHVLEFGDSNESNFEKLTSVHYNYNNSIGTNTDAYEFWEAYKKDYLAATLEDYRESDYLYTIRFNGLDEDGKEGTVSSSLPIYSCYTNVLALVEEHATPNSFVADPIEFVKNANIFGVNISHTTYIENVWDTNYHSFNDFDHMDELFEGAQVTFHDDVLHLNENDLYVYISYEFNGDKEMILYYPNEIPAIVNEHID